MVEKSENREVVKQSTGGIDPRYSEFLEQLKNHIHLAQNRAVRAVNTQLVELYWTIGAEILVKQQEAGWGDDVIGQLARDLKAEGFGTGFSRRNLFYMKKFVLLWPNSQFVQTLSAQISWSHHVCLLDSFENESIYKWYVEKAIQNSWSVRILRAQIALKLHERQGKSINNFANALSEQEALEATELIKDSYVFEFLKLDEKSKERDIENELLANVRDFLLELGQGFSLYGQQMNLKVGTQDFYLDLIFYHHILRRFIVIEIKMGTFTPEVAGKINFYLTAVDKQLRVKDDKSSLGIVLCTQHDDQVGRDSIERIASPIAITTWSQQNSAQDELTQTQIKELEAVKEQLIEKIADVGRDPSLRSG